MKRTYHLLLFLILILALACPEPAASQTETVATVRLSPSLVSLAPGEDTTIAVWVDNAVDLRAFDIKIQFDPELLSVSNLILGDFIDLGFEVKTIKNDLGVINYYNTLVGQPDVPNTGTGWLFSFDIEAKTRPGESVLDFTQVDLVYTDDYFLQTHTVENGLVRVLGVLDDHYKLELGETLIEPAPGFLSNDVLPEGDITVEIVTEAQDLPEGLVLGDFADGSFSYTPPLDFTGTVSFTYRACIDGGSCFGPALVSLEVQTKDKDKSYVYLPLIIH